MSTHVIRKPGTSGAKPTSASSQTEEMELIGDVSDAALVTEGRRVATPRVSREAARVIRAARKFFASASPALVLALCMSPEVLRILEWSAAQGQRAWRDFKAKRAMRRTAKVTRVASDDAATVAARGERDQMGEALGNVAAGDATELARITAAMQPAAQGENETGPGQALQSLVGIGRGYLKSAKKGVKARCAMWGVTSARLDAALKIAESALAAERAAASPAEDLSHEQAIVDRWDGINLLLLAAVVGAFAKAASHAAAVLRVAARV